MRLSSIPKIILSSVILFWGAAVRPTGAAELERPRPSFFAFQNGLNLPPAELASTLKEIGFDGLSTDGYDVTPHLSALATNGIRLFNTYLGMDFDSSHPALGEPFKKLVDTLRGTGAAIWLTIPKVSRDGQAFASSSPEGDDVAMLRLKELADYAEPRGVRIALYPHTGCWIERIDDAVRVSDKLGRSGVGVTFNLCHWLKVEGDRDPIPAIRAALPRLFFVSINGADRGDTRHLDWKQLIQPLDQGTYDVGQLVRRIRDLGYIGPFGLQGYGLTGDPKQNARHSMAAWLKMTSPDLPESEVETIRRRRSAHASGSEAFFGDHFNPTQAKDVGNWIETIRQRHGAPAVACAVIRSNQLVGIGCSGLRVWDRTNIPVALTDRWHHGSLTKSMTATLAAMLVADGRIHWDTRLADVFPDQASRMDAGWKTVTLEQLCSNRSGAPTELNADGIWEKLWSFHGTPREARRRLLELLTVRPPKHVPGTTFEYSNAGFSLAGAMLEETMNQSWEELITERLFHPLRMDTAGFGAPASEGNADAPWGHVWKSGKLQSIPPGLQADNPWAISPAGKVHCSVLDLARYAQFHLAGDQGDTPWLKQEAIIKLHTPIPGQEYAFGWNVVSRSWAGGTALQHTGSNTQWYSNLWLAPRRQFAVIALTNVGDANGGNEAFKTTDDIVAKMVQEFLPK